MAIDIDVSGMTAGEMADLGAALGCKTMRQVQVKLLEAQAMGEQGDMPLDMLVPMMWLARKSVDPSFTLEQARAMPFSQLTEGFDDPNASGGEPAESSPSSSGPSVPSTTTRRGSSGRSK
jgi:hypothetical protein